MVDTGDLKSPGRKAVRVQVPFSAQKLKLQVIHAIAWSFLFLIKKDGYT